MSALIACQGCDLLVDVSELPDGGRASCPRCGHFLVRFHSDALSRALAFCLAAIVFLMIANSFSFLSLAAAGLRSAMTLPETALALYNYDMPTLALLVSAFIIVIPSVVLLLLLAVVVPLLLGVAAPWLTTAARWLFHLYQWSMVEVFLIGVVVSLFKLAQMADVELGFSFWAYSAFCVCFTLALTSLDRFHCWRMIEQVQRH